MKMGVFAQWVKGESIEELAANIKALRLDSCILDVFPGMDINLDDPSPEHCRRIRDAFEHAGVELCAVGGYSNLIHQKRAEREAVHRRFRGLMKLCAEVNIPMLCSETGTFHPTSDWDWDPANSTEPAFQEFVATAKLLLKDAESYGVTLGFEPYVMNIAYTAERAARLIEELDSDKAKLVMDPAGLLTRATLSVQDEVIRDAFKHMAPHIGLLHVEDCRPNDENHFDFLGAGKGLIHYPLFMDLVLESGYEGPYILEHMKEVDIPFCRDYVIKHWNEAVERRVGK